MKKTIKNFIMFVTGLALVMASAPACVKAEATEAKNYTWYTTMAEVVRELKALTPEAGESVMYNDGHGLTVMYKYEYLDLATAELEMAYVKVQDPELYGTIMAYMAENGITLEDTCGWKLHELTWTTETIWEEVN